MLTQAFKRYNPNKPKVSLVLLDWSCRESLHSLDYLADQTVPRDDYEINWIEYYDRRSPALDQKIGQYVKTNRPAPVDQWYIMRMPSNLYYHKHLMYNIGIAKSRGDIVIICDSDAMFKPNFVATVIDRFEEDPRIALHFDQVRNARQDFYPFNYPDFDLLSGDGANNWHDGTTTGLRETEDPLHTRNYGACLCARRSDLLAIGGADEHMDYLGHVCGPYELTFRLVNNGLREVWHESEFIYHTWHPGSDGDMNYIGPSDGRHMSTTALEAIKTGRVMPLVENGAIRHERKRGEPAPATVPLIDPAPIRGWSKEEVAKSPRFTLFQKGETRLEREMATYNILSWNDAYFGAPHGIGPLDLAKAEDRMHPRLVRAATADEVIRLMEAGETTEVPAAAKPLGAGPAGTRRRMSAGGSGLGRLARHAASALLRLLTSARRPSGELTK